jgi:hypothetical protein
MVERTSDQKTIQLGSGIVGLAEPHFFKGRFDFVAISKMIIAQRAEDKEQRADPVQMLSVLCSLLS